MPKRYSSSRVSLRVVEPATDTLALADLEVLIESWLSHSQAASFSERTVAGQRRVAHKLLWFLRERGHKRCGPEETTAFFAYLATAHREGGRWAQAITTPLRPASVLWYYAKLSALFNWLVARGDLDTSPLTVQRPIVRKDQIRPFTPEQIQALFAATKNGPDPVRDEALLLLLYDTGIRASELCGLTLGDLDLAGRRCRVHGKGAKERTVYLGEETRRALRRLVGEYRNPEHPKEPPEPSQALFCSNRGTSAGEALSRGGLHRIIANLGKRAGVQGVRCSPHTLRHSFALHFLKHQGQPFTLQQLLGHTSLNQTREYVNLANADLEHEHQKASPADNLFGRRRKK